jgi:5-bromo-4-chloroindolyl phosphate hydrolysis protein
MAMFYGVSFLVLATLFFQTPTSLVTWIQYIISVFFQGVALPVLGYTSRKSGELQAQLLRETHDIVMNELEYIKRQQEAARMEREELEKIISEIRDMTAEIQKISCKPDNMI